MNLEQHLTFWGKAQRIEGSQNGWHPIAYHLLDVAAVAEALLRARPLAARRLAHLLDLSPDDARMLVVALAGLHDIGKFAPAFQAKAPDHWPTAVLGPYSESYAVRSAHTDDGFVLWDDNLSEHIGERLWPGGDDVLNALAPGVFGHHGRPVGGGETRDSARQRFRLGSLDVATACAETIVALLCPQPITAPPPNEKRAPLASWWVSGLLTVADWVGSSQTWFPYTAPANDDPTLVAYWGRAQKQAKNAVRAAGLVPSVPRAAQTFAQITRATDAPVLTPTPVQSWAEQVELPDGPVLVVIEDVTGSGKTEAAQMLVHRLMASGRATGAYWAMPTMATANAMYARQESAISALYEPDADGVLPSLVLAHGQQRLHEGFRATVLDGAAPGPANARRGGTEPESTVACAAFLADDRRAALLADVGAGTIDQAILGVLPSRFNTVRLFGLADKVLVIDEAHAYDAYVSVEVKELLRFQAALGGSAIVLSATLSHKQRKALAKAWADGLGGSAQRVGFALRDETLELASSAYPLATVVSDGSSVREEALGTATWSSRSVSVRLVHTVEDALEHVLAARERGGAVAWVRNTVDDCLAAAAILRERSVGPLVFHARFAQGDRQAREAEVMALFGKDAPHGDRRGRVLLATQVIEQSLDLDFDAMVSDVAPVDLLVQRAGRLQRHVDRDSRRPAGLERELVVLSPEPVEHPASDWLGGPFSGTGYVYARADVLWRTVRALSRVKCIETPGGLRALIEEAYDEDDPVPDALLRATERAQGKQRAHAAAANYAVLKAADGYHSDAVAWVSDIRAPTRLGDPRTTVRLARARPDGGLDPWVQTDGPPWKSWALSEVNVSAYRVPAGSTAEARFADAVARVRAGWGRFEQDIPLLPLARLAPGAWVGTLTSLAGNIRKIGYTDAAGLSFPAEEPSFAS